MIFNRRQLLSTGAAFAVLPAKRAHAEDTKRYHSDYFSFVGSDATGTVYLAHDNNRGQTGERFFADHWIMMYAEGTGIVPIVGSAHYPNPARELETIPDSEHFRFRGTVGGGMRMSSLTNGIEMTVEGLSPILRRQSPDNDYWIGAAPAVMQWRERTLKGRVIFEFIARTGYNRFTSDFGANWSNFNGLYLLTEDQHDLYLRYHERIQPGTPRESGMATFEGAGVLSEIEFRITEAETVAGQSYTWPKRWKANFRHQGSSWQLEASTLHLEAVADWTRGGFAMSVIEGNIRRVGDNRSRRFKGWAELLI
jgi:hypothetical protein